MLPIKEWTNPAQQLGVELVFNPLLGVKFQELLIHQFFFAICKI